MSFDANDESTEFLRGCGCRSVSYLVRHAERLRAAATSLGMSADFEDILAHAEDIVTGPVISLAEAGSAEPRPLQLPGRWGFAPLDLSLGAPVAARLYEISAARDDVAAAVAVRVSCNVMRGGGSVLWIDARLCFPLAQYSEAPEAEKQLRVAQAATVPDVLRQLRALSHIVSAAQSASQSDDDVFYRTLQLIVVDSAHSLFAPVVGDIGAHWNYYSKELCCALKTQARALGAIVLLTNRVRRGVTDERPRPALGAYWAGLVDAQIVVGGVTKTEQSSSQIDCLSAVIVRNVGLGKNLAVFG